jgi:predicted O-methyltransferase YrrM
MTNINKEIISNLYGGSNPFATGQIKYIDNNYPHTNIRESLVDFLLKTYKPNFWLELGAFVGGSALKVAKSIKQNKTQTGIICCDPFCGDVNMWDWEVRSIVKGNNGRPYKFIGFEDGLPTIYKRFIANVLFSGNSDVITPIQATSIVAIKLIERLYSQNRISALPDVIYLDSAHEADETYLELVNAWRILPSGGIMFGDDWSWDAVRNDVIKFSRTISIKTENILRANTGISNSTQQENIFLYEGQWVLFKE